MRLSGVSKRIDGYQDRLDFACQMKANGTPALSGTLPPTQPSNDELAGDCKIGENGGAQDRCRAGDVALGGRPTNSRSICRPTTRPPTRNPERIP